MQFAELMRFTGSIGRNKIWSGLPNRYLWYDILKKCCDIFTVRFDIDICINGTDVPRFIDDESCPF